MSLDSSIKACYGPPVRIGEQYFANSILNASGCWCKSYQQLQAIYENTTFAGVVSKTCTMRPFHGNPEPNLYYSPIIQTQDKKPEYILNCMGLPNNGFDYYSTHFAEFADKPYILSLSGADTRELITMLTMYNDIIIQNSACQHIPVSQLVEINISCPNVVNNEVIIGYHAEQVENICVEISKLCLSYVDIGFKLPPYVERANLSDVINVILRYQATAHIKFVVCSNSIPNGLALNNVHSPALSAEFGGISFSCVNKLLGLSNVYQVANIIRSHLALHGNVDSKEIEEKRIKIIGCGGVRNITDVFEYLKVGADMVQIGSDFIS